MQIFTGDCSMLVNHSMPFLQAVCGGTSISYQGESVDLGQPFRRASMHELVQEHLGKPTPASNAACVCILGMQKLTYQQDVFCTALALCISVSHIAHHKQSETSYAYCLIYVVLNAVIPAGSKTVNTGRSKVDVHLITVVMLQTWHYL